MPRSPIQDYLDSLHARLLDRSEGSVADYIPELAGVNPDGFGICIATHDGFVYEVGDSLQPFTIQSISKPLTYGLALEENGEETVLARIGVEPSGDAFNAISLQPQSGAPFNPLINAGAIAACGLIPGDTVAKRSARVLATFSRYAGRALDVDERVYGSESRTGHRNRAIGWMLRNFGILDGDPTTTLETYFRQCAIRVTCRDLALMGATLANGGLNPVTGIRALPEDYVENVLSVMATCGMYDFSGEWLYRTGLPAKSGVGGGILAVQPGRIGIGVYSPRLDAQGNSVRGIAVCRELASDLGLHMFDASQRAVPAMRLATTRRSVASKRRRSSEAAEHLRSVGHRLRLYHLQGALAFASVERVVRELMAHAADTEYFIVNLGVVQRIDAAAARLLAQTRAELLRLGKTLVFAEAGVWWQMLLDAGMDREAFYADDDFALERGEDLLLARRFPDAVWEARVPLEKCALFAGLTGDEHGTSGGNAGLPHLSRGADDHRGGPCLRRAIRHHAWRGHGEHPDAGRHRPPRRIHIRHDVRRARFHRPLAALGQRHRTERSRVPGTHARHLRAARSRSAGNQDPSAGEPGARPDRHAAPGQSRACGPEVSPRAGAQCRLTCRPTRTSLVPSAAGARTPARRCR